MSAGAGRSGAPINRQRAACAFQCSGPLSVAMREQHHAALFLYGQAAWVTRLRALLVPVLFAFQSLVVGENCPAPVDVEARVRTILHLTPEQELSEGFAVERHEAGLYVELRSADSTLIGQRTLPGEGNCDELAQAAAVVLSAWLSDVHPDFAGALPAPAPPEPKAKPAPDPAPALPPPPVAKPAPPPPPPLLHSPNAWDIALGIGGDLSGAQPALAGYLGVGYGARQNGWGLTSFVAPTLTRAESLRPGTAEWRRWPLGIGPSLRQASAGVLWDFNVGASLAWLHFDGSDLQHTSPHDGAQWGGFLNVRVANRSLPWGIFGLLDAQVFPAKVRVTATNVGRDYVLPLFGLALAVGVRFSP